MLLPGNRIFRWTALGSVVWVCFIILGCSPTAKHRILTLLLDGVPPIVEEGEEVMLGQEIGSAPEEVNAANDQAASAEPQPAAPLQVQHGPYAAKMCDGCHENADPDSSNRLASFTLKEEKHKLCLFCHEDKEAQFLVDNFKWVHGPVQYGECLTCHSPHESPNIYMLKLWPVKKQCYYCHDEERLSKTETHEDIGEADCIECHDAHAE